MSQLVKFREENIADKISLLIEQPELRKELILKGLEYSKLRTQGHFNISVKNIIENIMYNIIDLQEVEGGKALIYLMNFWTIKI